MALVLPRSLMPTLNRVLTRPWNVGGDHLAAIISANGLIRATCVIDEHSEGDELRISSALEGQPAFKALEKAVRQAFILDRSSYNRIRTTTKHETNIGQIMNKKLNAIGLDALSITPLFKSELAMAEMTSTKGSKGSLTVGDLWLDIFGFLPLEADGPRCYPGQEYISRYFTAEHKRREQRLKDNVYGWVDKSMIGTRRAFVSRNTFTDWFHVASEHPSLKLRASLPTNSGQVISFIVPPTPLVILERLIYSSS